ncbi:MAG: hypothetical protein KAT28_02750, partial [Candidatus Aenigmarchaeota archaeon]|nr:hypothetical protein [Candidatus Aenigmarchaeota archaeon]
MSRENSFVGFTKLFLIASVFLVLFSGVVSAAVSGITVTAPNGGESWSGTQSITWTATCSDPANDYVDIQWSTGGAWTTIASSQYCNAATYSWDTTSVGDSSAYQIKVKDMNVPATNDVSNAIFTVDNTAPITFTFVSPTEGDYANKSQDYYYVNVTFTETNPDTCWLDNGTTNTSMSRSGTNCYINMTSQSEATHTYKVWANDTAGNWGNSSDRYVTLDTTSPTVTNVSS